MNRRPTGMILLPALHIECDVHFGAALNATDYAWLDRTYDVVIELHQHTSLDRNANGLALVHDKRAGAALSTSKLDIAAQVP